MKNKQKNVENTDMFTPIGFLDFFQVESFSQWKNS